MLNEMLQNVFSFLYFWCLKFILIYCKKNYLILSDS